MSIITEALRKAEREREEKREEKSEGTTDVLAQTAHEASSPEIASEEPSQAPAQDAEPIPLNPSLGLVSKISLLSRFVARSWSLRHTRRMWIMPGIVLLCLFILVVLFRWPKVERANILFGRVTKPATFGSRKSPAVQLPFVLSGVSIMGTERYGVVNGLVVQAGDSVDGAVVKEITDREVILETRAGEIKLRLPT